MDTIVAVLIGIAVGCITGLVPGLHVNLIAALSLSIPGLPADAAFAILAVGTVHTFVTILPSTYLGAPGDSLQVLPAHRLLHAGAGPEAVRLSLAASLAAAMLAVAALWPYRIVLQHPSVVPFLAVAAPIILMAVPLWGVMRDARPAVAAWSATLAALLGHVAWDHPIGGWWPGSALLPLLSGLFGVPTLLWAIRRGGERHRIDAPPRHLDASVLPASIRGSLAACVTAVLPGMTAAVAAAFAMPRRQSPRAALATLSAVNTAHLILTLGVMWIIGRTRSGLAIAWASLRPLEPWTRAPPSDLLAAVTTMLVAGVAAVVATTVLEAPYRRAVGCCPKGAPEAAALVCIVALVVATTGWSGLVLLVAASLVGAVPLLGRTRRIHLAAALSVPIAIRLAAG